MMNSSSSFVSPLFIVNLDEWAFTPILSYKLLNSLLYKIKVVKIFILYRRITNGVYIVSHYLVMISPFFYPRARK